MEEIFQVFALIVMLMVAICFSYQLVYVFIALVRKPKKFYANKKHRYAVLISARNERAVIGNLIASIQSQTYDKDLIDIVVIADNCTDDTGEIAEKAGAIVYRRYNTKNIGKGYALDYGLKQIEKEVGIDYYDGYFVIDADNILEEDYVENMNNVFDNGYRVVTSYRNSKNIGSNWITFGYGLWFLREAKYINNVRMMLGISCVVSGTGFLVSSEILKKNHGWKHHLLTEDIEFSVDNIIQGEKIGYCADAIFYDEQPETFQASWHQRMRWSRGFYQVFYRYGKNLVKQGIKRLDFSCYDMFITLVPGLGVALVMGLFTVLSLGIGMFDFETVVLKCGESLIKSGIMSYVTMFILGAITLVTEWKQVHCKKSKAIMYLFLFPFFMFTYLPISIVALFYTPEWKPILHTVVVTRKDIHNVHE